jgi:hypothetical protein
MSEPTKPNPIYGTVTIKNSATVTTTPALTTTEVTGLQKKIDPANLPTSTATQTALNLKESTVNKQNSLSTDGTGVKFPTVDAVNGAVFYKRTIAQIRALTGVLPNNYFHTTDLRQEGDWYYDSSDTTTADNTGTVLITADGKRIKRIFNDAIYSSWFEAPNNSTDLALFNKIVTASLGKRLIVDRGLFNLQGSSVNLTTGLKMIMQGAVIQNGTLIGNGATIEASYDYEAVDTQFSGVFGFTSRVYYYKTMQEAKSKKQWAGKRITTGGFWYENDGGGASYSALSYSECVADNSYYDAYWASSTAAGGAGLFVKLASSLAFKYTGQSRELDLAFFGVKYDALFLNPSDKKYYTTSGYTVLSTDNYNQIKGAIGQLIFWSNNTLPKTLVLSNTLITNTKLDLTHGAYSFILKGGGYSASQTISSNNNLDAIIENFYDASTNINNLTATTYVIQDITFKGHGRIANGLVVKNGYEADGLLRLQFQDFTNAGAVFYGISSTFKADTFSCFRNKYGILIASTHPYRVTSNTDNSEGLISLYKISGDYNTSALIAIDCASSGSSINIQSLKSENNDNATILIKKSSAQQYISVKNSFTNGDGDFLKIENYAGNLPTIELEGIFHNDPDSDNWDINDLKNNKQIRLFKNPTAAFPHTIYTNNERTYQNGFRVYRNGDISNLESGSVFGTTSERPTNSYAGFRYFDTTENRSVVWNGTNWVASDSSISGAYTPTAVVGGNVTSIPTPTTHTYTKIGNIVTVYGLTNPVLTNSSVVSDYTITLPIARASSTPLPIGFGSTDLSPSAVIGNVSISSESTTTAKIKLTTSTTGSVAVRYSFQYDTSL